MDVAVGTLLEDRHDARLPAAQSFADELGRQRRLARARWPRHQDAVAFQNAAAEHFVQFGNSHGKPAALAWVSALAVSSPSVREKAWSPSSVIRMVCKSRHRGLAAQLQDLQLAHDGVPLRHLRKPQNAVDHREQRIVADLVVDVFADQERRDLRVHQELGQVVDERLHLHLARLAGRPSREAAEGIDHHDARVGRDHLGDDLLQDDD